MKEKHSQKKPLTILKFHYVFVNVCGAVWILGERAAAKYPLGCYEFKGQMLSLKFEQHLMQRYVYLICQTNLLKHVYIWLLAMMNYFQFVVLLKHNVNAHVRDESGRTALDVAICLNRCHFVEELKKVSFVFSS